jgi:serine/threonine-protein kinase HipA
MGGALLQLVQKEFGAGAFDNFDVLSRLGQTPAGSRRSGTRSRRSASCITTNGRRDIGGGIRFSLAGIQLKFSMKQNDKGSLTLPMASAVMMPGALWTSSVKFN